MTASEFRSSYGYDAARSLRGSRILLAGATYNNRDWIKARNGQWDKDAKQWSLPMPPNNQTAADLLYQIVNRGMQWAAK